MSKTINSLVEQSIETKNYVGIMMARFHFDPVLRYANTYQSIYWDEGDGQGEREYVGLGNLASISVMPETNELGAQNVQFMLSGIPANMITDVFSDEYMGKPVSVWYATLDKDTYAVEGGSSGPVLIYSGLMDYANIEFGKTCSIVVNSTSRLADWDRPRGGRYNNAYQIRHVDPDDTGFKFVQGIQNKSISWGEVSLEDPPFASNYNTYGWG